MAVVRSGVSVWFVDLHTDVGFGLGLGLAVARPWVRVRVGSCTGAAAWLVIWVYSSGLGPSAYSARGSGYGLGSWPAGGGG